MVKTLLYEQQVLTTVQRHLASARRFKIATAMVSAAGMDYVGDSIRRCLQKGGTGEILIGIDLPTDPKALGELLQIQSKHAGQLDLKTFRRLKKRIFHPKLFIFEGSRGNKSAVVGSSNLTGGGLAENYEVNLLVDSNSTAEELSDYFDEHFEGAYSVRLTHEWLEEYAKEWAKRKKLLDKLRQISRKGSARAPKERDGVDVPNRIKGYNFAFTGGIPNWPRDSKLYPYVRTLGGKITEAEHIANANCLVHGEVMNGIKNTRKLRGARQQHIPVISEEDFMALIAKEKTLRKRGRHKRNR
jgi:HKD family nuclease